MRKRVKERIFEILEVASPDDLASRIFDIFIMTLISLNVVAVLLETVETLSHKYSTFFKGFELLSVGIFTVEYVLRLWTCTMYKRFANPIVGRVRFALTPLPLVDSLAILPFYLPMVLPLDLRFIRALRLFRLFRFFKMVRYSKSLRTMANVINQKKEDLTISILVMLLLLVVASSLMYFAEHEAQPKDFSSIPAAMWWGVATLTTVGYGDICPVTPIGKCFGAIIAVLGIAMFALPAGILASGFSEEMERKKSGRRICPHCGMDIDQPSTPAGGQKENQIGQTGK